MAPIWRRRLIGSLASVAMVAAVTVVIKLVHPHGPSRGLAVLYIVAVLAVAVRWGPAFAFVASLLSAAAFDYFYLGPQSALGLPDLADAEAIAAFLATAIVASLLASRLRERVRQADRLAQEQAALRRIASFVARASPPTVVFAEIAAEVGRLLGAEVALLARTDPDGLSTVVAHWGAAGTDVPVGRRLPLAGGPVDPAVALARAGAAPRSTAAGSGLVSPVVIEGRSWGHLLVATPAVVSVNAGQQIAHFGELLATAIRNAENQLELRASRTRIIAASDETRRRIERDLHDGAQQSLVSLALGLGAVAAALPPECGDLRAELAQIAQGLVRVLDELRELSRGLHPAVLTDGGLRPALKALARRSPIVVELEVNVDKRLPQQVEVTTYYVVSELLTNAAKHARASVIHVDVDAGGEALLLSVKDDGIGGADRSAAPD